MTILMRSPRRMKKRRSSKDAREILDRLQSYLDENTEEPVNFLAGFWKDQQNAISYPELREAVKQGVLSEETFRLWQQDYSVLVAEKMAPLWQSAITAGSIGQPLMDGRGFELNLQTPGVLSWINERGADFVTSSTLEQKKAITSLLQKKIVDEHTVDELARLIRPCIGLTDRQAKAVQKLYDKVSDTLKEQHPRMKPENVRKKALDTAQKYSERLHRQRAYTIAQTEMAFAYNQGADQGIRQAQEQGLVGETRKRWSTSGDDNVCPVCDALDGVEIDMDDSFDFKGRELFEGQKMLPPAHPRCACAVQYIEVSPPIFQMQLGGGDRFMGSKVKKFSELVKMPVGSPEDSPVDSRGDGIIKSRFKISKSDDDKMLAFGWANVSIRSDGEVIEDWQEDIVEPEELEQAAYRFVELYREGGEMHERGGAAVLVESVVFTEEKMEAIGIPPETLPVGWWIGFKVLDASVWEKVKDGTYSMFSIEGEAERVEE